MAPLSRAVSIALLGITLCSATAAQSPRPVANDFLALGPVKPLPPPIAKAVEDVRAEGLGAHVALLASPSLEGRGLGSRGLEAAAEYVATTLARAGVPPLEGPASGTVTAAYFHPVPMREIHQAGGELVVDVWRGETTSSRAFRDGVDLLLPESGPEELTAPVVFAGFGIRESSPARDDYRLLDVKDKFVLVLDGLPPGEPWRTPALTARYAPGGGRSRFAAKLAHAAEAGARGMIAVEAGDFSRRVAQEASQRSSLTYLPYAREGTWRPGVVHVSTSVGDAILAEAGLTSETATTADPRELRGVTLTLRVTGQERLAHGRNVLGILEGSDPAVAEQAVIVGAHVDHLGRRGDTVYPGADDNASGTAAVLEIARAVASAGVRPRRTMIFAFWTGEEEGHLGSDHYVRHPSWPLEKTVAYVNLDMIGHPWTQAEIRQLVTEAGLPAAEQLLAKTPPADFLEVGLAEWAPDIAPLIVRAAQGTGVALHVDRGPGTGGGSDYRAFARKNVPWLRFFGNYFDGYHQPSDTAERLDLGQVRKMARLALATAWLVADR